MNVDVSVIREYQVLMSLLGKGLKKYLIHYNGILTDIDNQPCLTLDTKGKHSRYRVITLIPRQPISKTPEI